MAGSRHRLSNLADMRRKTERWRLGTKQQKTPYLRKYTKLCFEYTGKFISNLLLYMKREDQQDATIRCLLLTSV